MDPAPIGDKSQSLRNETEKHILYVSSLDPQGSYMH